MVSSSLHTCRLAAIVMSLQVVLQTQNSCGKRQRNAAVLQWHKETQEHARLARCDVLHSLWQAQSLSYVPST